MSALVVEINPMAAAGLAALLNTLWYAGAVVAVTWAMLRCLPRVNAATRYWIWIAVLGFLLVLPFLPGVVRQARTALAARNEGVAAVTRLVTVPTVPVSAPQLTPVTLTVSSAPGSNPWPLWLLAAWMIAAGWQLARLARGVVWVRRLKRRASSYGDRFSSPCVSQSRDEFRVRIRRGYQLLTSNEVASPVAAGYRRPAVIVPRGLLERLEESERRDVLQHELAHLARYDDWLALVTHTFGALLVLHPLAAIVMRHIEREREKACDDFVVAHTGSARNYVRSLARLHDLRWTTGTRLLAPELLGRESLLGDRIKSLLRHGRKFSTRPSPASLGASVLLLGVLLGAAGLIPGWVAVAQTKAASPTSFEVASIRLAKPANRMMGIGIYPSPGRFSATNVRLVDLIVDAYNVRYVQVQTKSLPSWARTQRYAVQAVMPPGTPRLVGPQLDRIQARMLQSLLVDRFKLKVHFTTKLLPAYDLMVAKGGPKMRLMNDADYIRAHHKPGSGSWSTPGVASYSALGTDSGLIATMLTGILQRPVTDMTGLTGRYDFNLTWTPGRVMAGRMVTSAGSAGDEGPESGTAPAPSTSGISIFTAIQEQLGLKLRPTKTPEKVLVVDHVERPTPN